MAADQNGVIRLNLRRALENGLQYEPARAIVRIHVLGSIRATTCLGADILPRGKKARAILGYLALNAGERVTRSRLASLLWDRAPDAQARIKLRQALRELSLAMGLLWNELISSDRETLKVNANLCWLDASAVLAANTTLANSSCSELRALCSDELLDQLEGITASFDQWLLGGPALPTDLMNCSRQNSTTWSDQRGT